MMDTARAYAVENLLNDTEQPFNSFLNYLETATRTMEQTNWGSVAFSTRAWLSELRTREIATLSSTLHPF